MSEADCIFPVVLAEYANYETVEIDMPTRNVVLTDQQTQFVEQLVASGRYQNASEVLRVARQGRRGGISSFFGPMVSIPSKYYASCTTVWTWLSILHERGHH